MSKLPRSSLLAIPVGGFVAGTLDILQACILFGWNIPLVIAGGLLGRQAFQGGAATYVLGLALHYFIATSATTIYYGVSQKLTFLTQNWIVCGCFFGMAVELFMSLIVLPLSALHASGPYKLQELLLGLGMHMLTVGLPVALTVHRFSGNEHGM
jgi:hypothetical protein